MAGSKDKHEHTDEVQHDGGNIHHVVGPVAPAGKKTVEVSKNFLSPEVHAAFAGVAMRKLNHGDALRPEKKRERDDPQPNRYAAIDHAEPVVAPEIDVNLGPITVIANLLRIKHQRAIDAGARDIGLQAGLLDDGAVAFGQFFAEFVHVPVAFPRKDFAERRETGRHRYTVGVVGAAVKNFMLGNQIHHCAAGAESSERQAPADGFGQANQVRLHAKEFAGPAPSELCAGLDFVEDQQRAVLRADVAQPLEEPGLRHAQSDVHHNGLENNAGDLVGIFLEAALDAREIVESSDDDVGEGGFRHATTAGNRIGCVRIAAVFRLRLNADERGVMQSMVAALELQNSVSAGCGARNAAGVHGDFGPAGAEAHHFHRIALANFLRELPFLVMRHAEGGSFMQFLLDGFHDGGVAVPGHQRTETKIVVNVFIAIDVVNTAALSILHEERIGFIVAIVAGNAKRNALEGALVGSSGFRRALFVRGDFFL